MEKKTIRINASGLKKSACDLAFWRTVIEGYKSKHQYNDVEFGSAVHLFLKNMFTSNGNIGAALHEARKYFEDSKPLIRRDKEYLTMMHLMTVCTTYWQWLQDNQSDFELFTKEDGTPAVELTFSNLFYEDDDYRVLLEGTIDRLGKYKGAQGQTCFRDYKTTSSHKIDKYLSGYELSTQMRFYLFNLQLHAKLNPDSFLAGISRRPIGCAIDGVFLGGADKTTFKSSRIMTYSAYDMDEMREQLTEFVGSIIMYLKAGILPLRQGILNGACNLVFGECEFANACKQPDKVSANHIMKQQFNQVEYRPLRED